MNKLTIAVFLFLGTSAFSGEKAIVSLRDMSKVELKFAGIQVPQTTVFHIRADGAGGSQCDNMDSRDDNKHDMFAYGWILNADTREVVWEMDRNNTSKSRDDRTFDGEVTLPRGSYEVYFAAATFTFISTFKNIGVNVDHREEGLFNGGVRQENNKLRGWFGGLMNDWFGDDIREAWAKRSPKWGIDILVDDSKISVLKTFTPPKEMPNVVFKATGLGENEYIRKNFTVTEPLKLRIYALGEGYRNSADLVDYGWIVNVGDRNRVWQMNWRNCVSAGGASKNAKFDEQISLPKGEYALYYVTDNSHSSLDWNCAPPSDPLDYGITMTADNDKAKASFKISETKKEGEVILSLVKVGNNESRTEGFTLKQDADIRVYAVGEQSNSRRVMADYAVILDAKTRNKVWTMNADNSFHAGGASKNRFVDEIVSLPKGSYLVQYITDDSHAYNDWNSDPPFDPEHYGVTIYGVGEKFDKSIVGGYVDQRDKNVIAQIIRVGDNEKKQQKFKLLKTTKLRVYGIGEGMNREMADYGWITDSKTGTTVWEMTYSMTVHAGGARKNRMVNTTIILDKGDYTLHFETDDSHAYRDWNQDPPEDQEYWGITLYPEGGAVPVPAMPAPPKPGSVSGRDE
ncbi:MAG: hypothetical protein ABI623_03555 [bacterium]